MDSVRSKAGNDGYRYTELTVGKKCRKRPLFIIIATAAKVTDGPLRSRKWGVGRGRTCGEGWTGQVTKTSTKS